MELQHIAINSPFSRMVRLIHLFMKTEQAFLREELQKSTCHNLEMTRSIRNLPIYMEHKRTDITVPTVTLSLSISDLPFLQFSNLLSILFVKIVLIPQYHNFQFCFLYHLWKLYSVPNTSAFSKQIFFPFRHHFMKTETLAPSTHLFH